MGSRSGKQSRTDVILVDDKGNTTSDVCNSFAHNFKSVYPVGILDDSRLPVFEMSGHLSSLVIDENIIDECVKKLSATLSTGMVGFLVLWLRPITDLCTPLLSQLFGNSFKFGVFLEMWKVAVVIPAY